MKTYLITGGTGHLGKALVADLLKSETTTFIYLLSRKAGEHADPRVAIVPWNGREIPETVPSVQVIINLAGAGIADQAWTDQYKELMHSSRILATQACKTWILKQTVIPKVFISGSAVGYYGGNQEHETDETSAAGTDFMGNLCAAWEAAAADTGIRTVLLRTGVVLDGQDGAFPEMVKPFRLMAGGPIGKGTQGVSWIYIEDFVRALRFIEDKESISGPVNITAGWLAQEQLAKVIARATGSPSWVRVPVFGLKLLLGERHIIVTGGQKVVPAVLRLAGFQWKYPDIEGAVRACLQ